MGNKKDELQNSDDALTDSEGQLEKIPYPKSVFFIVSNEFCERFSYYGMRTILTLYLVDILLFSKPDAKIIYHTFTMFVYFFPIFGAMLADSLLGKFYTIFYVSIIYAIGNVVLAMSAAPPLNFPMVAFSMVGLLLIAIGTGGIKPCVSAFGGDQFRLPQQELQLAKFFSMFYFSINAGSLISTTVTPLLREDVHCFGDDSCYSLAFGVPGVLMIVSIIIFVLGKPLYIIRKPEGNMVIRVSKCISTAIKNKWNSTVKHEHWLDHATKEHGEHLVNDVKALLKVLFLYIPLPVFWALFDQQGTGWTFQARIMNGDIGFYTILPDQMQVVNPLLILLFIPIFQYGVYPLMDKLHILQTPLKRLVTGGLLAALAFVVSACISLALEAEMPKQPSLTEAHIRIYNNLNCDLTILNGNLLPKEIKSKEFYVNIDIENNWEEGFNFECGGERGSGTIKAELNQALGYYFIRDEAGIRVQQFVDSSEKDDNNGYPKIRILASGSSLEDIKVNYYNSKNNTVIATNASDSGFYDLKPDDYRIEIGSSEIEQHLKLGGVYAILLHNTGPDTFEGESVIVTKPNSIHMLLLIPQYVIITAGEIMFSITGLEFSYSQAPKSMKSVLQACWLLTTAVGNLIVIIIESVHPFDKESLNFFLYAGLMTVDMFVFALMAMRYKYVKLEDNNSELSIEPPEEKNGIENKAYLKEKDEAILTSGSSLENRKVNYYNNKNNSEIVTNASDSGFYDLKPDVYRIEIGSSEIEQHLKLGGVYAILLHNTGPDTFEGESVIVTEPNSIHMLLLIPQYVIITAGEIMFSITGLEFSYLQAPKSMKSVLQACWLLTTAVGNLIVIIIESVHPFDKESLNFFLYAGLMTVDMFVFALMAMRYKYVKLEDNNSELSFEPPAEKNGIENKAYLKEKDEA